MALEPWYPPKDRATRERHEEELQELLRKRDTIEDKIQSLEGKLTGLEAKLNNIDFNITVHQCWLGLWREFR